MKLLFLTKYTETGASSRYRCYNYLPYFKQAKIEYEVFPFFGNDYIKLLLCGNKFWIFIYTMKSICKRIFALLTLKKEYDLLIIEKELIHNLPYFFEKILLNNKKYVLDFDDYLGSSYKVNELKRLFLKDKMNKLVSNSLFTTVGNHWYFTELPEHKLLYLPTVIDIYKYNVPRSNSNKKKQIVWIGSSSTVKYLYLIEAALIKLKTEIDFELKVIGAEFKSESLEVNNVKWTEDTEVSELATADVGVMPLADELWEKGKCGFKLIQYMACGIPVVASPEPANLEIVEHNINGFIARSDQEWYDYLKFLLLTPEENTKMGASARNRIENHYAYQIWGDKYVEMIKCIK